VFSVGTLLSAFLIGSGQGVEYGVSYYPQPPPAYAPQQPYYEKPSYYETYDTQVDVSQPLRSLVLDRKGGRCLNLLSSVHSTEKPMPAGSVESSLQSIAMSTDMNETVWLLGSIRGSSPFWILTKSTWPLEASFLQGM